MQNIQVFLTVVLVVFFIALFIMEVKTGRVIHKKELVSSLIIYSIFIWGVPMIPINLFPTASKILSFVLLIIFPCLIWCAYQYNPKQKIFTNTRLLLLVAWGVLLLGNVIGIIRVLGGKS